MSERVDSVGKWKTISPSDEMRVNDQRLEDAERFEYEAFGMVELGGGGDSADEDIFVRGLLNERAVPITPFPLSAYHEATIALSPLYFLPLEDDAGSTELDLYYNGDWTTVALANTGTYPYEVGAGIVSGDSASAFKTDSLHELYADLPGAFAPAAFSVAFWANTTTLGTTYVLTKGSPNVSPELLNSFYISHARHRMDVVHGDSTVLGIQQSSGLSNQGITHFIVYNYDTAAQEFKCFVDGVESGGYGPGSPLVKGMNPSAAPLRVFNDNDGFVNNGFFGLLGNMAIWNRVLTPAEITYLYNLGTA